MMSRALLGRVLDAKDGDSIREALLLVPPRAQRTSTNCQPKLKGSHGSFGLLDRKFSATTSMSAMATSPKVVLCLLVLILRCKCFATQTYTTNSCYTMNNPIINVTFDSVNRNYSFTTEDETERRQSRTDILFSARECDCADYQNGPYYCPVGLDYCFSYGDWQPQPQLYPPFCTRERSGVVSFAISIAPALYGFFVMIFIVICCSKRGEFALSCCCNFVVRGISNQIYASYLLRRDPELARAMIRQWCLRRWAFVEAQRRAGIVSELVLGEFDRFAPAARPASLRLRTKYYKSVPSRSGLSDDLNMVHNRNAANNTDDEESSCTICFIPLSEGDRIGNLDCKHEFHSECLKDWLKKKNSCPLCLRQDIAEVVFQDSP